MIFLNLLGLLGLLGLVALIIIYILKPKYEEKMVSSTHIWKLSLKYRRPKSPFDWLKSSLLFIIQVLIITTIALLLTEPMLKSLTVNAEKIIVLDGSASMQVKEKGVSRFDLAKNEILKLANETIPQDRFTLIYLGETLDYVVRRSNNLDYIRQHVNALKPTDLSLKIADSTDLVESVLRENPDSKLYIFSSKNLEASSKITLVNYNESKSWNAGIVDFTGNLKPNGYYMFQTEIVNYGKKGEVPLILTIDGVYKKSLLVNFEENEKKLVTFDDVTVLNYKKADIALDVEDDYLIDNSFTIFNAKARKMNILMYSESEDANKSTLYYLNSSLNSLGSNVYVKTILKEEELEEEGYDIYIYDSYTPTSLPTDGSIWLFNPSDSPLETPLNIGSDQSGNFYLQPNISSSITYQKIMRNVNISKVSVSKYKKISAYPNFESLASIGNSPLLLSQDYHDQKIIVVPFDLSFSNLPILIDFPFLINNMFNFSTVKSLNKTQFEIGETLALSPRISAYKIDVKHNEETKMYLDFPVNYKLNEVGVYEVEQSFPEKLNETDYLYVHVAFRESYREIDGGQFILPHISAGEHEENFNLKALLPYILIGLFILMLIEWLVQYREQY